MILKSFKNCLLASILRNKGPLICLLDDKIDQDAYDGVVATLNTQIEKLVEQLNMLQYEEKIQL